MRAYRIDLEALASSSPPPADPGQTPAPAATPSATEAAPAAPPAPTAPLPLARALENAIASVVLGPSRLVLVLSEDGTDLEASFAAAGETTRRRALHVRLGAGPAIGERAHTSLIGALMERTNGRPGVAALLDPLVKGAASFVLGKDLWSLEAFLTPEALDEVPAVASRVLLTRFVPALAAQYPDVPRELLAALLAERTGSALADGGDLTLAAVAAGMPAATLLRALSRLAARAGVVIVFSCASATDFAAASALDAATSLQAAPTSVLWALGARRDAWEVQRSLLDAFERRRVENAIDPVPAAPEGETPAAPSAPLPANSGEVAKAAIDANLAALTDVKAAAEGKPDLTIGANLAPRARAAARRAATGAPAPVPAAPATAAPSEPGKAARLQGADETPPLAIPRPIKVKNALAERLKKAVAARLEAKKAAKAQPKKPAPATNQKGRSGSRRSISGTFPAWTPRPFGEAQPTGLKRVIVVALPFVFLASLGIFARREADFRAVAKGPTPDWVLKLGAPPKAAAKPAAPTAGPAKPAPAGPQASPQPPRPAAPQPQPQPQNVAKALPQPPATSPPPVASNGARRGGLKGVEHAAPASPDAGTAAKAASTAGTGGLTTVQDRLMAAERLPQGNEQLAALITLYDLKLENEGDNSLQKRGVLLRLAPYRSEPEALDRIMKSLDATASRDLRLTAIQALSIGNTPLAPVARQKLQTLVNEDPDEAIKSASQIALAAQPR